MKICFFTENYYEGGVDTFLINLFNAWPDKEDDLTLICNASHPGLKAIENKTFRPIKIALYRRIFVTYFAHGPAPSICGQNFIARSFLWWGFRVLQYPILFPWYVFTLTFFFAKSSYDRLMVVNGGYPASLLCRSASIAWWVAGKRPQSVLNFHSSTIKPKWCYKFLEYAIDRLVIRSTLHIVSVSNNCIESLNSRQPFLGCKKLSYIYNGINDPALHVNPAKETLKNKIPDERYCLMLSRYDAGKGHLYLLQAFKMVVEKYPTIRLRIYGYGTYDEKKVVSDEVERLNLKDQVYLGDFEMETAELISKAALMVVPSQSVESFGLTIIEAMAFGIPVVTTDVGGMPEVLSKTGAGYVCSKDDSSQFAGAIINILSNPLLASELSGRGRQVYESKFKAGIMAQKYKKILG